ncbi:hypothetical protein CGI61_23725 [Vibrio parahaemolyticus]|nr:hypothetical protein CGI61_23725 [Vibrio parahaemolyticus]
MHAKVREVASLIISFGCGNFSGAKCGKGKFMESLYSLKFRLVKFLASKSQIFAFKPRSELVSTFP